MTRRGFLATKTATVLLTLAVAVIVIGGAMWILDALMHEPWSWAEFAYLVALGLILQAVRYARESGGGSVMSFVLRTRPQDLDKDPEPR